jgi:hypothetical protein
MTLSFDFLASTFLAQLAHFLAGAAITAVVYIIIIDKLKLKFKYYYTTIAVFMFIIFLKESLFDPHFEQNQPFFWNGVEDMLFYLPGLVPVLLMTILWT